VKKNLKYRQGIFRPLHPEKYKGTFPIFTRSSWEMKACRFFDHNPNVISWGSESVVIPYQNPLTGRVSRYFVDFVVTIRDKSGEIKKYLIEIKPQSQTIPPVQKNKNTKTILRQQAEYIKNQAKWKAAQSFSESKGYTFTILTEKHLGIK
jgi:hypothetical protein